MGVGIYYGYTNFGGFNKVPNGGHERVARVSFRFFSLGIFDVGCGDRPGTDIRRFLDVQED